MKRTIISIQEDLCNGCGICVDACHEGAIGMVNGKAKLLREDYCDGLGDCLPACPTGAISFIEKDTLPYDAKAVACTQGGCAGTEAKTLMPPTSPQTASREPLPSALRQWPVQLKLAPLHAPYFEGADLLIAADCSAFAHGDFHRQFMQGKVTLIGCPKLDSVDYSEKLTAILRNNAIASVTVVRMQVPCCGGIALATKKAVVASGKALPLRVVTLTTTGEILSA